jgi:pyruvate ferredoxin oxidoreductase gamma subunit
MIRVRFHGRGGHGVKTAARILGTAAFLAGRHVQDSPIYGAERRGAPVAAFARISDEPILERGVIDRPDLIVVADETLFRDDPATVLAGQQYAAGIFVNCSDPQRFRGQIAPTIRSIAFDITAANLAKLGRPSALSAGLGAAAARLISLVGEDQLVQATREELAEIGVAEETIERNVEVAREVFASLPPLDFPRLEESVSRERNANVVYDGPVRGAPSIRHAGNAALRRTGAWRLERPTVDREICTRCGLCFVQCPDGAIALDGEGYPIIDYDHCKGCLICQHVCPMAAIQAQTEVAAW